MCLHIYVNIHIYMCMYIPAGTSRACDATDGLREKGDRGTSPFSLSADVAGGSPLRRESPGRGGRWLTMGDVPHECVLSYPKRHPLQRSACAPSNAKPDVPERPISPGADVGGGEPSPGTDVGRGGPSHWRGCGRGGPSPDTDAAREPSPGADVGRGEPSPGADVAGVGPVQVPMCACLRGRVRVPVQLGVQPQQQRPFGEGECLRLLRVRGCVCVRGRSHARVRASACVRACVRACVGVCVCI
jgi:hypothetical protein